MPYMPTNVRNETHIIYVTILQCKQKNSKQKETKGANNAVLEDNDNERIEKQQLL